MTETDRSPCLAVFAPVFQVRHLLIREKDTGVMVDMISVKDIVKCTIAKHDAEIDKLTGYIVNSEEMQRSV